MADWSETGIRWTDYTWNPVHGCSKTSEGCKNCYAERVSRRFNHSPEPWTVEHAEANINTKPHKLDELESLPESSWVFVNSMSDLFHDLVDDAFVEDVFEKCGEQERSAFQVLSKHGPDDDREIPHPPDNVMLGVSVESQRRQYRIDWLREQPAATKFISFEPLVECIRGTDLDLEGIDWAIIGGESGPEEDRRPMESAWARNIVWACRRQDVAVFFKQHSGPNAETDVELDLRDGDGPQKIEEFPELPDGIAPAPEEFRGGESA